MLRVADLKKIDKLVEIYEGYKRWDWRFGETPKFTNGIEKKFDWALVDLQMNVEKGIITDGCAYTDCLVPAFIDELNEILKNGKLTYDVAGVETLGKMLYEKFADNDVIKDKFVPELVLWMRAEI